jgi:hypothetical protein
LDRSPDQQDLAHLLYDSEFSESFDANHLNPGGNMTRSFFAKSAAVLAILTAIAITPALAQQATSGGAADQVSGQATPLALGKLEFTMRQADPDGKEFGMAVSEYWKLITESNDGSRVYNFFRALNAEQKSPNATLLAHRASAACYYMGWLSQNESAGQSRMAQINAQAQADFEQALKLDPENFSALYGYAVYQGYIPGGQAHQKELLTRLDALRASRPYYPWQLVDTLEKTGKPE